MAYVDRLDNIWKNQKLANFLSYLIVAGMLVCFSIAFKQLGENYFHGWNGNYLPYAVFLVSLEAIYGRNLLSKQRTSVYERDYWAFRAAEWIIIFILFRIFLYIHRGPIIFMQDLQAWKANWYTFFYDPEFFVGILFLFIIWSIGNSFGLDIDLLQSKPSDTVWEKLSELEADRKVARYSIFSRSLTIGMVLVFVTVILRLNLGQIFGESTDTQIVTLNVLVYFGLAVILLSLSQFALIRGRWLWERTPTQENIASRWFIYAATFLMILVAIALILPTAYTIGFLETVRLFVQVIAYAFSFLFFIIMSFVSFIFSGLLSLLGFVYHETPTQPEKPLILDQLQQASQNPGSPNPWLEVAAAVGFWLMLIFLVCLAFWYYFRQNHELLNKLRSIAVVQWVTEIWGWLVNALRGIGKEVKISFNEGVGRIRQRFNFDRRENIGKYISLRKLNAKEKVIFYYLAMLRRGEERGFARKLYQTPSQYIEELKAQLPDQSEADLEIMTDNFLEARYSMHTIGVENVNLVQKAWKELRTVFRRLRNVE